MGAMDDLAHPRNPDGRFRENPHFEADVNLLGKRLLSDSTPAELDNEMADRLESIQDAQRRVFAQMSAHPDYARRRRGGRPESIGEFVERMSASGRHDIVKMVERERDIIASDREEVDAIEEEYEARGGWTRAFLATTPGGHVHSSMYCSTCNNGAEPTTFQLMVDYSGADEEAIVDAAGYRACTVCYPSAPVGDKSTLPTRILSKDEERAEADSQERARRKSESEAKKVANALTPDGSTLRTPTGEKFKTERSAITYFTDSRHYAKREKSGDFREQGSLWKDLDVIERAVAAKHGRPLEEVRCELDAKAAKKLGKYGIAIEGFDTNGKRVAG